MASAGEHRRARAMRAWAILAGPRCG